MKRVMQQRAPYPHDLIDLIENNFSFLPGWTFQIGEGQCYDGVTGLLLMVYIEAPDSQKPGETTLIAYPHMVPAEVHTREGWTVWLWHRCMDTLRHEAGEFFWADGVRPFAPDHWPVADGFVRKMADET